MPRGPSKQPPPGVEIGTVLVPKRGRSLPICKVENIYRSSRRLLVRATDGSREQLPFSDVKKNYHWT